jgi:hypothetical protein
VDSNIRSHVGYSANCWRLPAKPFKKHRAYDWPDTGASLILISYYSGSGQWSGRLWPH